MLFLSDTGIRSLRVENISLAAGVTDVGSPIDGIIQPIVKANAGQFAQNACACIEPNTGRYWLAIGSTIYVLSYWPSAKINAWSTFSLGFNVDAMVAAGANIYIRSGNTLYLYGGLDGNTYDTSIATVQTPMMSADSPTRVKSSTAVSAMVQGNWAMGMSTNTALPFIYEPTANLTGDTYSQLDFEVQEESTHFGFQFTCADAGPSLLGAMGVRFKKDEDE